MQVRVILGRSEDGGFTVRVPSLPGCISEGDTRDEALANIREALQLYLEPVDDGAAIRTGLSAPPKGQACGELRKLTFHLSDPTKPYVRRFELQLQELLHALGYQDVAGPFRHKEIASVPAPRLEVPPTPARDGAPTRGRSQNDSLRARGVERATRSCNGQAVIPLEVLTGLSIELYPVSRPAREAVVRQGFDNTLGNQVEHRVFSSDEILRVVARCPVEHQWRGRYHVTAKERERFQSLARAGVQCPACVSTAEQVDPFQVERHLEPRVNAVPP